MEFGRCWFVGLVNGEVCQGGGEGGGGGGDLVWGCVFLCSRCGDGEVGGRLGRGWMGSVCLRNQHDWGETGWMRDGDFSLAITYSARRVYTA